MRGGWERTQRLPRRLPLATSGGRVMRAVAWAGAGVQSRPRIGILAVRDAKIASCASKFVHCR